ncbi:phage protein NinX family protein [Paraburkholderia sp. JHI2823]
MAHSASRVPGVGVAENDGYRNCARLANRRLDIVAASTIFETMMLVSTSVSKLAGAELDYWVARALHECASEISFADDPGSVFIKGYDRGGDWNGRFAPSSSWAAASLVLDRTRRLQIDVNAASAVHCVAEFAGSTGNFEADGISAREALLRAFVKSRFGDHVGANLGGRARPDGASLAEPVIGLTRGATPAPEGERGDIRSLPRQ